MNTRHCPLALFCAFAGVSSLSAAPIPRAVLDATKSKDPEEAKKAARYKALREGYEGMRDSLPKDSPERLSLEGDMNLARELAETLLGIERTAEPKLKALKLEVWESTLKPLVKDSPRCKELFDIYYYELSQKAGPIPPVATPVQDLQDRPPLRYVLPHRTIFD